LRGRISDDNNLWRKDMSDIRVSVIIPIYNAERHLEECLDSCLSQDLEQIEIICVNDGSTDNTGKILERYSTAHANIVVLNQENQGAGAARNLGMTYARGEFVAFMDSDDYYPDQYALKKLYKAAIEKEVLVCGGSLYFMDNGKVDMGITSRIFRESRMMHYRELQRWGGFTRFIYNTHFLKNNKIFFPEYRINEDPPFFVETMVKTDKFYVISDCVYLVRRNTDKIIPYDNSKYLLGALNGSIDILKISKENHFEKLHTDVVVSLIDYLISLIYKNIYNKNLEVRKCYVKILEEIDEALLVQDNRNVKKPELLSDNEINNIVRQSLEREKILMNRINSYKKILIYGAGEMGHILYSYIRKRGCDADIDFMVSAENPDSTACGKKVKSIYECTVFKEDALVIIANKNHYDQMKGNAQKYQFKNIEVITYKELMLFGADMMTEQTLTIY